MSPDAPEHDQGKDEDQRLDEPGHVEEQQQQHRRDDPGQGVVIQGEVEGEDPHEAAHDDDVDHGQHVHDHVHSKPSNHSRNISTASFKASDENATLAALAAASSSSLPISPSTDNLTTLQIDESSPSFMLVASLRAQITDLTSQVTSLNAKLVRSYTQTGDLEDELHEMRQKHQLLHQRLGELEQNKQRWEREIEGGGWVERDHVQGEMQRLMTQVLAETASRETAVQAHSALETEIESLTSTLFDEANKMVVHERIARAQAEQKTRSLDDQVQAMQAVMDGVQVNLRETVTRLEQKETEARTLRQKLVDAGVPLDDESTAQLSTSIGTGVEGGREAATILVSDGTNLTPVLGSDAAFASAGAPQLDLVSPRLLNSVLPYHEFLSFVTYLRQLRVSVLSKPLDSPSYSHSLSGRSFSGPVALGHVPASASTPPNPAQMLAPHLPLSTHLSQPFLKRCIEEDSDPSLRLDLAPGLGFLSRRNIAQAIYDGQLVIEPLSSGATLPSANCSLCGTSLERWSGGAAIAKPTLLPANASAVGASVNSTMRKYWGSSGSWITGGSTPSKEAVSTTSTTSSSRPSSPPLPPSHTDPSPSFTLPQPTTLDGRPLHIHVFRVNGASTTRYAICPLYCLGRLRAVCEFWTYVRALERGLLVEEGFKFVRGRGSSIVDGARSTVGSEMHEKVKGESVESALVETGTVQEKDAEEEKVAQDETVKSLDQNGVEEFEPKAEVEEKKEQDQDEKQDDETSEAQKELTEEDKKEAGSDPTVSKPSSPTTARPPVPKRSAARSPLLSSSPALPDRPKSPTPRESPQAFDSQPLAPPPPPPRRSLGSGPAPPRPPSSPALPRLSTVDDVLASAPGWEDVCWSEVVRLKESVFWTRMAAFGHKGQALEARRVEVGSIES